MPTTQRNQYVAEEKNEENPDGDYDPLLLFTMIGLVLEAVGLVVAWPAIFEFVEEGTFTLVGRALVGIFFWLAGLFSIFTGVILDTVNYSIRRIERRASGLA